MTKKDNQSNNEISSDDFEVLYSYSRDAILDARKKVYQTANLVALETNWKIGKRIIEIQGGEERAKYGNGLLRAVSEKLTFDFGKGFTERNLRAMRQFYITFPNWHAVRAELSWTHYRSLIRVENSETREIYMNEAADNGWGTRLLDDQVDKHSVERLIASHKFSLSPVDKIAQEELKLHPADYILKDPLILDFYELSEKPSYSESDVEQGIIDNLQKFLLELGKGFSFVSRQQHISTEFKNYYIDLVFYNYILKCFVLVDVKLNKLTHQDIGQMDMYVRMYDDMKRQPDDNPTIGIILCEEKDRAEVKYSVLAENEQLFATKYKTYLPTEEELIREIENTRELLNYEKEDNNDAGNN